APLAGGSEYGVRMAPPQPVVTLFTVPATAPPGRPPRVALRIDERGVATVNVRVSVHDLSTRRAVAVPDPACAGHLSREPVRQRPSRRQPAATRPQLGRGDAEGARAGSSGAGARRRLILAA